MTTRIRATISEKSKYWIDKHRHYELKHFCLQYPTWKRTYTILDEPYITSSVTDKMPSGNLPGDPTAKRAITKMRLHERIEMIENVAREADQQLYAYILKGVTEGLSYTYLKSRMNMPCGKDMYYDRYRKFFWLLNKARD